LVEAGEVVRREDFSLHDGKVDLDLIKPTRVDWAMNERQAAEDTGTMNVESGDVGPGSATAVFVFDAHRALRRGAQSGMLAAPRKFRSHLRDYEYKRLGTVSLLAGLDLHTVRVTEIVSGHHASVEFIALLGKLDEGYPPQTRIRLLLDNHSAHISKETQGWLSLHPNRFEFVFTPKHGSWLNIVETLFGKMARSTLRGIRVASKQELNDRIHLYFPDLNADR
jgi:transposase